MPWYSIIALVAISFWGLIQFITVAKSKSNQDSNVTEELTAEITALKDRVETLEKIVTDEGYQLNKQFSSLND